MYGTLKVKPLAAKLTRDTEWIGKMDPYVKVRLGQQEKVSSIQHGAGKFPSWADEFVFERRADSLIEIQVWDYDTLSKDDLIGETTIPIQSTIDKKQTDDWYTLSYRGRPAGQIRIVMSWTVPKITTENAAPILLTAMTNHFVNGPSSGYPGYGPPQAGHPGYAYHAPGPQGHPQVPQYPPAYPPPSYQGSPYPPQNDPRFSSHPSPYQTSAQYPPPPMNNSHGNPSPPGMYQSIPTNMYQSVPPNPYQSVPPNFYQSVPSNPYQSVPPNMYQSTPPNIYQPPPNIYQSVPPARYQGPDTTNQVMPNKPSAPPAPSAPDF